MCISHMVRLGHGGVSELRVLQEADQEASDLQPVDRHQIFIQSKIWLNSYFSTASTRYLYRVRYG